MGKNLKKVIFSVLLLAAVIIVSPKDAKAAGKVWMAGFNDNSITIQWTPQSLNGYRVDGYYLEEIGTQRSIWQGSANTTQVTVQATKGYSGYIRLGYRLTSLATGKTYNWSVDSVYVNTTPADVAKNNFGITAAYANIKKVAFKVNKPEMATGVQLEVYNAKNKRVLSKTSTSMGYESMNVSKIWRINIVQDTTIQTEATIRHTMEDGVIIATSQCHLFQERQQTRKKESK